MTTNLSGFIEDAAFTGLPGEAYGIGWSADGSMMAAAGVPSGVIVWPGSRDNPVRLPGPSSLSVPVWALDWHPLRPRLAAVLEDGHLWLWDIEDGSPGSPTLIREDRGYTSLAWAPDGSKLAVGDTHGYVRVLDADGRLAIGPQRIHQTHVTRLSWSHNGQILVACGEDGMIASLEAPTLGWRLGIPAASDVRDLDASPVDEFFASTSDDNGVRIWDLYGGQLLTVLEGHHDRVSCLRFSPDGQFLASGSTTEIRLWRREDWECVATKATGEEQFSALAFHPAEPMLAAKNYWTGGIDCYRYDQVALGKASRRTDSRRYVNAKVVLLGDTSVGKSALHLVLSGRPYKPTDSTHGRQIVSLGMEEVTAPGPVEVTREIWLWDLAGQPSYRLVHQLHLHEVAVALVVFDSRSETQPFAGVKHWARALAQASRIADASAPRPTTYLVAARIDRGGIAVTRSRVHAILEEFGMEDFIETSAREGLRIAELRELIKTSIDWDCLPMVSSTALFESIKQFLIDDAKAHHLLSTVDDLFQRFGSTYSGETGVGDLRQSFETCIGLLQSEGLVSRLRFGDYVLLRPEYLDGYASALIQAAAAEPDGLGFIPEDEALAGTFMLSASERLHGSEERLLLIATIQELLRREIALKETTEQGVDLIFPAQFTREPPEVTANLTKKAVIAFQGALTSIYASLAVRLCRSVLFKRNAMWSNVASYTAAAGGVCSFELQELEEGHGELALFYDDKVSAETRAQFESYVTSYLNLRAIPGTVLARRVISCPRCGYELPDDLVRMRRAYLSGRMMIRCPACDRTELSLADELLPADATMAVDQMNRSADLVRDLSVADVQIRGKRETDDFDVFLSYNSSDRDSVLAIANRLVARGILPWLDVWEIQPGKHWQPALSTIIRGVRSAAVFIGPQGIGRWQLKEVEELLRETEQWNRPIIPVILPGVEGDPEMPPFLGSFHLVDMRQLAPDPFDRLVWGITSQRPDNG
jgi:GTPase SAR1 family protein